MTFALAVTLYAAWLLAVCKLADRPTRTEYDRWGKRND